MGGGRLVVGSAVPVSPQLAPLRIPSGLIQDAHPLAWPLPLGALLRCPPLQVKGQSEELSAGYCQLQAAQEELEAQRAELTEERRAVEASRAAAARDKAAAEAAAQAAAEARLEAAAQQRQLGQERLEAVRAAEAVRELQMQLAARVQAAVAARVPRAEELWQQLGVLMGGEGLPALAPSSPAKQQALAAMPFPPPAAAPQASPFSPAGAGAMPPAQVLLLQPQPGMAAVQPATSPQQSPADDSSRYRAMLADLESSIDRWRGQLRAGEPLTLAGSAGCSLGGASFWLGQAQPAAAAAPCASSPVRGDGRSNGELAAAEVEEAGCGVETSSPSRTACVQTAVSFLDAPRAVPDCARGGCRSMPCSPAACRGGYARAAMPPRPASAATAEAGGKARSGGGSPGSPTASFTAGDVRSIQGLTLQAEYSMGGAAAAGKPRKWLKFKGGSGRGEEGEGEAARHGGGERGGDKSWGRGIFAWTAK